jgi:hypothetical protein
MRTLKICFDKPQLYFRYLPIIVQKTDRIFIDAGPEIVIFPRRGFYQARFDTVPVFMASTLQFRGLAQYKLIQVISKFVMFSCPWLECIVSRDQPGGRTGLANQYSQAREVV